MTAYAQLRLVRLGSRLRLTSPAVERFLPERVEASPALERLEQRLARVRNQLLDGHRHQLEYQNIFSYLFN